MAPPNLSDVFRALAAGGLDFQIQPRLVISDADEQTIKYDYDNPDFIQLEIQSDSDVYHRWDADSGDTIVANTDPVLSADILYIITAPVKLALKTGDDIYLHFKQVTSAASKFIKVVKL